MVHILKRLLMHIPSHVIQALFDPSMDDVMRMLGGKPRPLDHHERVDIKQNKDPFANMALDRHVM